jgi:hypothetical protein
MAIKPGNPFLLLGIPLFFVGMLIGAWGLLYNPKLFVVGFIAAWGGFAMTVLYSRGWE